MSNIREVVQHLNDKLFSECPLFESDYFQYLEYIETPIGNYIKYMGNYLWDSENCSHFDEIGDGTLENFLYQEILKILKVVKETAITVSVHE